MAAVASADGARARMQRAAIELFTESGYQATTVDQIAARAGVTQRTFFRHFVDKGEVLFDDDGALLDVLVGSVGSAPTDQALLLTTRRALGALADVLQPQRETLRLRAALIIAEPDLHERELLKLDRWHGVIAATLTARGAPAREATLATAIGNACWMAAYRPWVTDRARASLHRRVDSAFTDLVRLAAQAVST